MKKRQVANKLSFLISLLLLIQVLFPAANVFAAEETNNNVLPPSNFTHQLLTPSDVKLTWSAVFGAAGYKVYEITDGQLIERGTSTTTSFTIKSLPEGSYSYVVSTLSPEGESGPCAPITVNITYPDMAAPALTYTIQNGNDIVLSWTASPNVQSYNLYQIQTDGQTTLVKTQTTRTYTITNTPAGTYKYAVTASNSVYGESPLSAPIEVAVVYPTLTAPGNFTFTITNVNDVNLKWSAASYATNYNVYQIIDGQKVLKSTVTGTTVAYTNQPVGEYVYEVYSYSSRFGESPESSRITATVGTATMAAPGNLTYKLQNVNDVVLTWNTVTNATSYKIYQVIDGQPVLKSTVTSTTVTYTNQPTGDYVYEVHSYSDKFGESAEGSQVSLTLSSVTMVPPGSFTYKLQNTNDIVLTWGIAANANSYKIYQIIDGQKVLKSTITGTTVTYTNQSAGNYVYEVHSFSTRFGESSEGSQVTLTIESVMMTAPGNFQYKLLNGNDIVLTWDAVTNATSYKVYQITNGQKTLKSTVTGTTVTYANQPQGNYTYEVHSFSTRFGESSEGTQFTFQLTHPTMEPPANLVQTIKNATDFSLTWNASAYATSYKVYQIVNGQKVLKSTLSGLTVTYAGMSPGDYTYEVHSVSNRFGESLEGTQVAVKLNGQTMLAPANPTYSIANGNDVTLKWSAVTYATSYKIYQVVDGQKVLKSTVTGTTVTYTNQPEGTLNYEIHSFSTILGESPEGAEITFTYAWPTMQAPGGFTQSVTGGNDITFKWNAVTYASGYNLYQVIDGQEVLKKTQSGATFTLTNQPEDDYTYVVRSYSSRFGESPAGSELKFTLIWPTMQAPGNFTKTIVNGNDISLTWNIATYATAYKVYQVVDGQKVLKSTLPGRAVSYVNMPAGEYSYMVYSYSDRFGESPIGSTLEFLLDWPVVKPPILTGSVFNANNITLSWPTVTWANEYRVYNLTGGNRQLIYKGPALSYKVYNLSETTHQYEVTAYSTRFGESAPSNRVTETIVFPVMQPPVASVKLLSSTSARISWSFVTYANGYNVYELIDGQPILLTENLNNLSYTVSDLSYKDHEYYVTSYSNSFGKSEPSNTVLAKLIIDTEAPVTKAEAPAGWMNQNQVITLSATDNETGVANTFYSLNEGEFTAGTSVKVDKEGINKVSFYSVDKVGNTEAVQTISVKIDQTLPSTKVSEVPAWFTQTAILKLTTADTLSGVAKTYYSVNGSEYAEGNSIMVDNEGANEVSFYSVDQAGNKEKIQTIEVKIDRTAPVTSSNASEAWSTEKADVTLTAVDTQSGVAKTYYSVNGSDYVEGTLFTVDNEGINRISFYSVDQAGNKETAQTVEVKIDRTAPVTVSDSPTAWVKEAVVHLTATDTHSGAAKTYYSINGSDYLEGTLFTVEHEGVNEVSFYSIDQAGNKEAAHAIEVKIDRTAPVTSSSAPAVWSKEDVAVKLTAMDTQSGTAQTFYSIDGSAYAEGNSFTVSDEGIHKVTFYSVDKTGNTETENTAVVKIDKTAPIVAMNLKEEYQAGTTLQLTYSAVDTLSGIVTDKMIITRPSGTTENVEQNSGILLDKPGVYTVTVTVTNAAGLSTTLKRQFTVYLKASITVTPNVIKGNKGVFTVRVDLPNGYSTQGFDLDSATLNGVKALNSNNGYYNQAKLGQFKFERSDFDWKTTEVTLHFRGYVNGILVIGETTVKVQK